jgi:PIN domain nuclease of toxin-antitoxin system
MQYLMDTHVFLWWCLNDSQLSDGARKVISAAENEIFFSAASGWEIALKAAQGRLTLPEAPLDFVTSRCQHHKFQTLPVRLDHTLHVAELPAYHHDPFDRLLVAQCQLDGLPLITANPDIVPYDLEIAW